MWHVSLFLMDVLYCRFKLWWKNLVFIDASIVSCHFCESPLFVVNKLHFFMNMFQLTLVFCLLCICTVTLKRWRCLCHACATILIIVVQTMLTRKLRLIFILLTMRYKICFCFNYCIWTIFICGTWLLLEYKISLDFETMFFIVVLGSVYSVLSLLCRAHCFIRCIVRKVPCLR